MMLFFVALNLSIAKGESLSWSDLELNHQYVLTENLELSKTLVIAKNEKFTMLDTFSGEAGLFYIEMHLINCKNPKQTSEMILINPSPNDLPNDRTVAVQLSVGCNLDIWIEGKDYFSPSLFNN